MEIPAKSRLTSEEDNWAIEERHGEMAKSQQMGGDRPMFATRLLLVGIIATSVLLAQTPPCGRAVVVLGGSQVENQFIPSPPEHVKESILKSLPVVAALPSQVDGLAIEAKTDGTLHRTMLLKNKKAGVRGLFGGMGAHGTFKIDIKTDSEKGVAGSRVHIEFSKNKMKGRVGNPNQATPLAQEAACLAGILSLSDPQKNPRGTEPEGGPRVEPREITVPKGTPVKLLLREFLYSKDIKKKADQPILFEIAEDVRIDGGTVIRKGALATGRFTSARAAGRISRGAKLAFVMEKVTAVDGQSIAIFGATEESRGKDTYAYGAAPLANLLGKGEETLIRAGTGYVAETSEQYSVKVGRR